MDPFLPEGHKERQQIIDALKGYPHSFLMADMQPVRSKVFESVKAHLEAGLRAEYSTSLETARTRNLLAYALFRLDAESSEAVQQTEEVLKMEDQKNNIVSLANKAYMLSQTTEIDEAKEVVVRLESLREGPDFEYLMVRAKAELAASYLRFGPRFNKHAADAFKEVIPQAREPEVWMWKFGLAVAHRHTLNLQYAPYASQREDAATHRDAMRLLREVLDSPDAGDAASANLKANAHAEMALLVHSPLDKEAKNKLCLQANTGPMASCKAALKLDDNDSSVLWKTGKIYRNYRDKFKSRKLLEKAVDLQPSSAAYHQLGLTYKAMATDYQYGKLKTRRSGRRVKERRRAKEEKLRSLGVKGVPEPSSKARALGTARENRERDKVDRIKKTIKSPKGTTQFDPKDHNVKIAIDNLKRAVEFSHGENSRALYDLALMHKATGNNDDALKRFAEIGKVGTSAGLLDQITALEQRGLIYEEMSDMTADAEQKKKLIEKKESMLNRAVSRLAELYSTTAEVKYLLGKLFHSPSALLKAADASSRSEPDKKKTKAKIFDLINNHKRSLALLGDVAQEDHDADYYKLQIEVLARGGELEKAAACIAVLKLTEQYSEVMKLFEQQGDGDTVPDIYLQLGRKALLEGASHAGCFSTAFRARVKPPPCADSQVERQAATPERPAAHDTSPKRPAAHDATLERPAAYDTSLERPAAHDATVERPAAHNASLERPAAYDASLEQPAAHNATLERPAAYDTSLERPATHDATLELPAAYDASLERPAAYDASLERPAAHDASLEQPAAHNATLERPAAHDASLERPAAHDATVQRPAAYDTSPKRPAAYAATGLERPAAHDATFERPAAHDATVQRPAAYDTSPKRPAAYAATGLERPAAHGAGSGSAGAEAVGESARSLAELYDVMLLHDDEEEDIEGKATRLADILRTACGLSVVRRHDDHVAGVREQVTIVNNMDQSRLIVFLPGKEDRLPDFEVPVTCASQRESTVVLLTEGVTEDHVPRELRTSRCRRLRCPPELFAPDVNPAGPYTEVTIEAICRLFKFFTRPNTQ